MRSITSRLRDLFGSSTSDPLVDPIDYDKAIHLDVEELAEQGMLSAYEKVLPALSQYTNSALELVEKIDTELGRYIVSVGERSYVIWEGSASNTDGWERATVAFFELVNANLSSSHKFYALYGGNDLTGVFLTESEFQTARKALPNKASWPWVPVNQPPDYGFPVPSAA